MRTILAALAAFAAFPQEPARTPLEVRDLYRFDAFRSTTLSPDGRGAVSVRVWIDGAVERQSLWAVHEAPRPLEAGEPDARSAVFSPDGKRIVVFSTRPRPDGWTPTPPAPPESDPAGDLWVLPAGGGPAIPLAGPDKPYGRVFNDGFYGRVSFSPDGRLLLFSADDGKDPRTPEERAADVIVVRPDGGEGYTGYGTAQLWVAHLDPEPGRQAASRIERLTRDEYGWGGAEWSPDGRSVVAHVAKVDDLDGVRFSINKNFDLWRIDVATGRQERLTSGPGPEVSPRFSPDGRRVACLSVPRTGSHRDVFNLAVVTLGDAGPRTEILFDHHGPDGDRAPHRAPGFPLPDDCWDGEGHLVYTAEAGMETATARVNLRTGREEPFAAAGEPDPSTVAGRAALRQRRTPPGNLFLRERVLGETRVVTWDNGEGMKIEGVLTLPPPVVAKAPYKLVVYPHGGPHSRSTPAFNFTAQVFAANGYAVFEPNFRGSAGYGQKFIDADRFDFGGGDMRDLLTGVDVLVKEGLADRDRQFVFGSSYGGFMTSWLVGRTDRFKAAVAQNAVTDLHAMWGLSDLQSWTEWEFGGKPWDVPGAMRRSSPLTHVGNVKTPTLILHSREDRRVPMPMGLMFHRSLKARGVPTEMVIYPNEGHGIRQPRHREDVLKRTLEWFARHSKP